MFLWVLCRKLGPERLLMICTTVILILSGCGGGTTGTGDNPSLVRSVVVVGEIVDPKGQPLSAINVSARQSGAAAVSDSNGRFELAGEVVGNVMTLDFISPDFEKQELDLSIPESEAEILVKIEIDGELETLTVLSVDIQIVDDPAPDPTAPSSQSEESTELDEQSPPFKPTSNGINPHDRNKYLHTAKFSGQVLIAGDPAQKARVYIRCEGSYNSGEYADASGLFSVIVKIGKGLVEPKEEFLTCDVYVLIKESRRAGYVSITGIPSRYSSNVDLVIFFPAKRGELISAPNGPDSLGPRPHLEGLQIEFAVN